MKIRKESINKLKIKKKDRKKDLFKQFNKYNLTKHGLFKFKCGKKSNIYYDFRSLSAYPNLCKSIANEMTKQLNFSEWKDIDCLSTIGFGSVVLASYVSHQLNLPLLVIRENDKKHGLGEQIVGYSENKFKNTIFIDDIMTSGGSMKKAYDILLDKGITIQKALIILKRNMEDQIKLPFSVFEL